MTGPARPASGPIVLVRMPNWLGDCVMAMPALRHIAETLPEAGVFLAARAPFRELLAAQSGVAGFLEAPANGPVNLLRGLLGAGTRLRMGRLGAGIDLGVLFTNSFSSALWLRRLKARLRVGYDLDWRRRLLTHPVPCAKEIRSRHFVQYYLHLARVAESAFWMAGQKPSRDTTLSARHTDPGLETTARARVAAAELLSRSGLEGPYAVIAPASAHGPVKDWPAEHYRRLIDALVRDGRLAVALAGSAGQADICAAIAAGREKTVSLAGQTSLCEFVALIAESRLFVGGDSGGAHVAAALGVPTLAIFGATNSARTSPVGVKVAVLGGRTDDLDLEKPEARDLAREILRGITPEKALEAIGALLYGDGGAFG